jgi:type IV secretory pathway VirB10-like protein
MADAASDVVVAPKGSLVSDRTLVIAGAVLAGACFGVACVAAYNSERSAQENRHAMERLTRIALIPYQQQQQQAPPPPPPPQQPQAQRRQQQQQQDQAAEEEEVPVGRPPLPLHPRGTGPVRQTPLGQSVDPRSTPLRMDN